ncbi:tail fiber protein [Pseudoduganella sp. FT25W]|uniref:Tail fiber protein n=1 Tax=Duganella alba TaxID=2666081 RepID=A0A6L5QJI1_9BURK|nr:phage tail protein [Duganella alba]MRX09944.1 tail fiber protein [Duganella alba]MRX17581.1 tail fiber protein [Duganella alba]
MGAPGVPRHLPWNIQPGFGELPVGSIIAFAGNVGAPLPDTAQPVDPPPPAGPHVTTALEAFGWMLCDGRALDRHRYPQLFAALGWQYGGDQSATFYLPDYRGYFLRGVDHGRHTGPEYGERSVPAGGTGTPAQVGSIQGDAVQNHEHGYIKPGPTLVQGNAGVNSAVPGKTDVLTDLGPTDNLVAADNTVRVSTETRAMNIYVNYLIKFTYGLAPTFPGM